MPGSREALEIGLQREVESVLLKDCSAARLESRRCRWVPGVQNQSSGLSGAEDAVRPVFPGRRTGAAGGCPRGGTA